MKEKKLFKLVFGFMPNGEERECTFVKDNELLTIQCRGMERSVIVDECTGVFDFENDELIFEYKELFDFPNFDKWNVCPDCNDNGHIETRNECHQPASGCCGGCTVDVECYCEDKPYKNKYCF